jgi:hypothetical protein
MRCGDPPRHIPLEAPHRELSWSETMKFLVVIAALFASAALVTPTVVQGQFGDAPVQAARTV